MKQLSYEQAIKRLQEIISLLESNTIPLEDSIALYQEGIELSQYCDNKLKSIQEKVALIYENGQLKEYKNED